MAAPDPVDAMIGNRMRVRRMLLGLSQSKIAEQLGLTFQQVQKYEKGYNRVGPLRLYEIARALDVPVAFFFQPDRDTGMLGHAVAEAPDPYRTGGESVGAEDLMRAFMRVHDPVVRRRIIDLVVAVGSPSIKDSAVA
jgi:transcriptional regulator with XRE-family HTH domain